MKAILIKINKPRPSTYGGTYIRTQWRSVPDNKIYMLDVFDTHYLSKRFIPYLEEQNVFDNLRTKTINGKNYIDGTSNFRFLGKRHV